ncbi:MAG: MnhB domain-containing protein [Lachnospiraceae bacterium]|nr:MnhB domain-containing protein [Lachnospiraceae bacterium]
MSRRKDNYENSRWLKFKRWVDGEVDFLADGMETVKLPEPEGTAGTPEKMDGIPESGFDGEEKKILAGEETKGLLLYRKFYQVMSVLLCCSIIFVLLWTVAYLPEFGNAGNPDNNEVSARYIEQGLKETGAVNMVTGMILDYRAFDTFGESCVLFIASCCVMVLLKIDRNCQDDRTRKRLAEANDRLFEPKNDIILQKCACVLVPLILLFGVYIVLNGHLSPGGGFSGGAVIGSGMILYLNAFGFQKTERFFTEKTYRRITVSALTFYCLAKSYSFFTGANHLESGIPLGTPGAILSSGLILPLNICVGMVVACTMYAFYTLFRKGDL